MMIAGFILSHLLMVAIILGCVMPRYYDVFVPVDRRDEGTEATVPGVLKEEIIAIALPGDGDYRGEGGEMGMAYGTSSDRHKGTK